MDETATVNKILQKLELQFEHQQLDDDIAHYTITLDAEEDETVEALLYTTEEGSFFRLFAYVDEVDKEDALQQLKTVLMLNGDLPTGAFCLDPDEDVIDITVNLPLPGLTPEELSWMIEFCFVARQMYYDEVYPQEGDEIAKG
jgi:hypothetical protein